MWQLNLNSACKSIKVESGSIGATTCSLTSAQLNVSGSIEMSVLFVNKKQGLCDIDMAVARDVCLQVDFGEDVCIFGEKFVVGLTDEIDKVGAVDCAASPCSGHPLQSAACGGDCWCCISRLPPVECNVK